MILKSLWWLMSMLKGLYHLELFMNYNIIESVGTHYGNMDSGRESR